jgi:ABC-type transport system substrate-binding protein
VQLLEWTVFLEEFALKDNFDALMLAWVGGDNSPDRYEIWHSSQADPYELNVVGYKSATADALIEELRRTYDEAEQIRLARQLHRVIADDQPYTFLFEPLQPRVIDRRIFIIDRQGDQEVTRKIETPPSGDVMYFFRQWRKRGGPPELAR